MKQTNIARVLDKQISVNLSFKLDGSEKLKEFSAKRKCQRDGFSLDTAVVLTTFTPQQ